MGKKKKLKGERIKDGIKKECKRKDRGKKENSVNKAKVKS